MSSPCYLKCQNDTNSSKCNFLKKHEFKKRMPATFVSKFLPVSEFYYFLKRVRKINFGKCLYFALHGRKILRRCYPNCTA